jgi:hypothetical protein
MTEDKPTRIVYLFGAGATHAELQNIVTRIWPRKAGSSCLRALIQESKLSNFNFAKVACCPSHLIPIPFLLLTKC